MTVMATDELLEAYVEGQRDFRQITLIGELIGVALSDIDLSGAELRRVVLNLVNLSNANLSNAKLREANLSYADLSGADLSGADLQEAILTGANLQDANLSNANLTDTYLNKADLRNCDMKNCNLSNALLFGAYLSDADKITINPEKKKLIELAKKQYEGTLTDAELAASGFNSSQLTPLIRGFKFLESGGKGIKTTLKRRLSTIQPLSGVDLSGTDLSDVTFVYTGQNYPPDLSGADLSGTDLSSSDLSKVNLSNANLSKAILRDTNLSGANLSGANLSGADLYEAVLLMANLKGANLNNTNLKRTYLKRADLRNCDLKNCNLNEANTEGVYLTEADLTMPKKENMKIVVIGETGSGKSTLLGKFFSLCRIIDKEAEEKIINEAMYKNKAGSTFAWMVDKLEAERESGMTMEVTVTSVTFRASNGCFLTFISTPAHRDYIKKTTTAISQADYALLVVPAETVAFERSMNKQGQTREYINMAAKLGIKGIIIAVNKMDTTEPPYSEQRFQEIEKEVKLYAKKLGFRPEETPVIPMAGRFGDNLIEPSDNIPWCKAWEVNYKNVNFKEFRQKGKTLLEALISVWP